MADPPSIDAINAVEERYARAKGERSLGEAYALWAERWNSGARDLETARRLLFLIWYSIAEPAFLTGLGDCEITFREVFESMGGLECEDPEFHFVVALMSELFPYFCGREDQALWVERSSACRARYEILRKKPLTSDDFRRRGAYGAYFAHMIECTHQYDKEELLEILKTNMI